ncbi:hypothetical protein AB0M46_09125 [Dactylosporangium sp. NPDC051485]|uniref:hypothetical protein n=1 Tax=Dactylosporangium sp. NPDC051485 TaxID=3154846 RepID=UPI0034382FFC
MRRGIAAVVAILAGAGLAGCRAEPGVAVYLGDRKVTVDRVDRIVRSAPHSSPGQVVSLFICGDAGGRLAAERKLEVAPPDPAMFAVYFRLPEDSEYVRLWARCFSLVSAATNVEMARPLTDGEAQRLVDALSAANVDVTVADARRHVEIGPLFEAQQHFAEAIRGGDVVVNPRYEPVFPVFVGQGVQINLAFAEEEA